MKWKFNMLMRRIYLLQYELVCDRKWMISMTKTIYMLGYFFGALSSGAAADKYEHNHIRSSL